MEAGDPPTTAASPDDRVSVSGVGTYMVGRENLCTKKVSYSRCFCGVVLCWEKTRTRQSINHIRRAINQNPTPPPKSTHPPNTPQSTHLHEVPNPAGDPQLGLLRPGGLGRGRPIEQGGAEGVGEHDEDGAQVLDDEDCGCMDELFVV